MKDIDETRTQTHTHKIHFAFARKTIEKVWTNTVQTLKFMTIVVDVLAVLRAAQFWQILTIYA